MIGDPCEDIAQIGFWVETVQLGRADQAVNRCGPLTAGIRACEKVILASQNHRSQSAFGRVMPTSGLCRVHWILEVLQGFKMVADAA